MRHVSSISQLGKTCSGEQTCVAVGRIAINRKQEWYRCFHQRVRIARGVAKSTSASAKRTRLRWRTGRPHRMTPPDDTVPTEINLQAKQTWHFRRARGAH